MPDTELLGRLAPFEKQFFQSYKKTCDWLQRRESCRASSTTCRRLA